MFVHYKIKPVEKLIEFIRDRIKHATYVLCDELDCNKSFMRKDTKKTPEEILAMVPKSSFIHCAGRDLNIRKQSVYELCLNVKHPLKSVDYFIWIR